MFFVPVTKIQPEKNEEKFHSLCHNLKEARFFLPIRKYLLAISISVCYLLVRLHPVFYQSFYPLLKSNYFFVTLAPSCRYSKPFCPSLLIFHFFVSLTIDELFSVLNFFFQTKTRHLVISSYKKFYLHYKVTGLSINSVHLNIFLKLRLKQSTLNNVFLLLGLF